MVLAAPLLHLSFFTISYRTTTKDYWFIFVFNTFLCLLIYHPGSHRDVSYKLEMQVYNDPAMKINAKQQIVS